MDKELYDKLIAYRTAMIAVSAMLREGILSREEYDKIDTILTNKYGVNSCSIFCE